jgi:hypothetical protein
MTDVIDRRVGTFPDVHQGDGHSRTFGLRDGARLSLASASAAAGVIHLVMLPSHWDQSAVEGAGFAAAGWFQLAFAAMVLLRPSRLLLSVSVLANLGLIGAWAVSRTTGLPFGAHAGHAESVSVVDAAAVGLELALILGCARVLTRPPLGSGAEASRPGFAPLAPLGVAVLTTAVLVSPNAHNHAADSHGDHTAAGAHGQEHSHGEASEPADDKGLSLLHNGQHAHIEVRALDRPTQAQLDAQLAVTRDLAQRYPTVAEAVAAGYRRVGPFLPGIGAHFMGNFGTAMNPDGAIDDGDLRNPLMIIYDGIEPDAKVAGFMFYSTAAKEPQGFAGDNDVWHYHEEVCIKFTDGAIDVPYGLDHQATPQQCRNAGGSILPLSQWMVHVWSVKGYKVAAKDGGVFGEVNPKLTCPDGTYYTMPLDQWASHPLNVCKSELA